MKHNMHLSPKYFEQIRTGSKTIEIRVHDEKRRAFAVGDEVVFIKATNFEDEFSATITEKIVAEDFSRLCDKIDISKTGFKDKEELLSKLSEMYDLGEIKKNGVVAFVVVVEK